MRHVLVGSILILMTSVCFGKDNIPTFSGIDWDAKDRNECGSPVLVICANGDKVVHDKNVYFCRDENGFCYKGMIHFPNYRCHQEESCKEVGHNNYDCRRSDGWFNYNPDFICEPLENK